MDHGGESMTRRRARTRAEKILIWLGYAIMAVVFIYLVFIK